MKSKQRREEIDRFNEAIQIFVDRVKEDRWILAVVLVGSISDETIWYKDTVHVWIIETDGVSKRLKSDGNDERVFRVFVEDDINFHAEIIPRSRFKQMVDGSSRTAFSCNFFAKRELIYCNDPSIETWFEEANHASIKDQAKEKLSTTTWIIHGVRHAWKELERNEDRELARQTLLWTAHSMAALEVVKQGEVFEGVLINRAMETQPELFEEVYIGLLSKSIPKKKIAAIIERIENYLEESWEENLKPLLDYVKKQKRSIPLSEISDHFAYSQLYPWHLESACEWLVRKGYLEKLSAPFKVTKKSRSDVEEPAYFLDNWQ